MELHTMERTAHTSSLATRISRDETPKEKVAHLLREIEAGRGELGD